MLSGAYRRPSKFPKILTQLNDVLVFSPVVNEKSITKETPSSILHKVRRFCEARLTQDPKGSRSGSTLSPGFFPTSRVSKLVRTEAQDVLFRYLYCTRSLSAADAEHISHNSPHFLQNLLSKIDGDKDVGRSLTKFLRYHPINEFEPFFESLGLSPSEHSSLLPQHLIFLSDDRALLENSHVLCNYGIPRSSIGKMYKEAREIFGYDSGLLALKLESYENLGLRKSTVIKLVSCCPSLLIGGVDVEFVSVLEKLKRLGINNDRLGQYLSVKRSYDWKKILDTMDFLGRVGYSNEQLHCLFKTKTALVFQGCGKKFYALFGRLIKLGLKRNEVYSLFIRHPQILLPKCQKRLLRVVDILFYMRMRTEDVANIVYMHTELLFSCSLKGPKTVCKDLNIKKDSLCKILRQDPMKFFRLASKSSVKSSEQLASQDLSKQLDKTTFLLRLGYVENSEEMMKALKKFQGRGDQLQERFDCLVLAGLRSHDVAAFVKSSPMMLNHPKEAIEKKIDCLTNCLSYPIESILSCPAYLCYNMERINHRFGMYAWLRDRDPSKPMLSLSTILACSDARFVKYFVDVHPEGPAMWERLRSATAS